MLSEGVSENVVHASYFFLLFAAPSIKQLGIYQNTHEKASKLSTLNKARALLVQKTAKDYLLFRVMSELHFECVHESGLLSLSGFSRFVCPCP